MTVEEMRALMRRRVVPENLVVQNIVEYLMDDSAQLPQLNAFTFLSRLHELGMGSADFLTLLDGCGAPKAVVNKIRANPAMNLHNLVLTLENSGLTSDDYSEMLYTARLVWEQTQTSGGTFVPFFEEKEKTEAEIFDDDIEQETANDVSQINTNNEENAVQEISEPEPQAEENSIEENEDVQDVQSEMTLKDKPKKNSGDMLFISDTDEKVQEEKTDNPNQQGYTSNTTTIIVSLDPEQLKKEIGKTAEEIQQSPSDPFEEDVPDNSENADESIDVADNEEVNDNRDVLINEDNSDNEDVADDNDVDDNAVGSFVGKQLRISSIGMSDDDSDDEDNEEYDDSDDEYNEYDDEYDNSHRLVNSGYNKPALITSAIGAVILFIICGYFTVFGANSNIVKKLTYAKDAEEIFMEVYESYTVGNVGGENNAEYFSSEKLFGTSLVSQNGFGVFTDGTFTYTVSENKIIPHSGLDVNRTTGNDILPPENTKFVDFIQGEDYVAAVFTGTECGFVKLQKGEIVFTAIQDGSLCDYSVNDGEISFGSVYTPHYTHNFNASDINEYCPHLGKNEKTPVTAENIALGNSSGCSFAVWGKYSLADGSVISAKAAIGNPVYAGADGICALNFRDKEENEFGRIIRLADEITSVKIDKITLGASGNGVSAFLTGNQIIVLDENLEEKCILQNFAQTPSGMKFEDKVLLLNGGDGIFSAVNCADAANPALLETQKENGIVIGDKAVLFNVDDKIEARLMTLENGEAIQTAVYEKQLAAEEMPTVELGNAEQMAINGENCAFSYRYFDGVSVVSVCAVFGNETSELTLYDDRTGYSAVFAFENKLIAVSSKGAETVFE